MQVTAVVLARTIAFFDVFELNPRGKVFFPALVPSIAERFQFQTYPRSPEQFDEAKGITFENGYVDGQVVDNFTLYTDGVKLDLRSSTDEGARIVRETLTWLMNFGVSYNEDTITHWSFVSNVVFNSNIRLSALHPALTNATRRLNSNLAGDTRALGGFEVDTIKIDLDRSSVNRKIAAFTIQKRANVPFSEGRFFSAAPLSTNEHIALLEAFEHDVELIAPSMS